MSAISIAKLFVPKPMRGPIRGIVGKAQSLVEGPRNRKQQKMLLEATALKNESERIERRERRRKIAMWYYQDAIDRIDKWVNTKSEEGNFLYAITPNSRLYLSHDLSNIFSVSPEVVRDLFSEIENDAAFNLHIQTRLKSLMPEVGTIDIGRRLGWYAAARLLKPKVIVETGVDYGLGSCVLCAALLRNSTEGFPGRYFGTDIRREAGQLLEKPYDSIGSILYGDSIETLTSFKEPIDLFINDSDHSIQYEAQEYETIRDKLSERSVILGDNSHYSMALANFSEATGRQFSFFRETPKDHWYPGAGIGFSYPTSSAARRRSHKQLTSPPEKTASVER